MHGYHMTCKMALTSSFAVLLALAVISVNSNASRLPLVINTWPFTDATEKAWEVMKGSGQALDAVVEGCRKCQTERCDGTVGYGGSPDESGETTLDAMIMDGDTYQVGAVGDLRRVKDAIGVARAIMDYTQHTMLVGESATKFAVEMGFTEESLSTNQSIQMWKTWQGKNCQPNYRRNVSPNPRYSCGPYKPSAHSWLCQKPSEAVDENNHDTIGMVVIDRKATVVAGTSTNGMNHKVPGRVGDSPIIGAGSYASSGIGGAAATGDGDIMMRFLPSFHAVTLLSRGMNVTEAAQAALAPIRKVFPTYSGAIIVADAKGRFDAACHNLSDGFHYSAVNPDIGKVTVFKVKCM